MITLDEVLKALGLNFSILLVGKSDLRRLKFVLDAETDGGLPRTAELFDDWHARRGRSSR